MSSEIPLTSTLMARLFGPGSNYSAASTAKTADVKAVGADKPAQPIKDPPGLESTTIAVSSLTQKAQDLGKLLDNLDTSITTLQTARDTINAIVGHIEEAGGITVRARDTIKTAAGYEGNKDRLAELEKRYDTAMAKIDTEISKLATGVNLLKGDTLETAFDNQGKSVLATQGYNISTQGLEVRKADFSSAFTIQDSRIDVMNSIDIAVTLRHQITSDMMLIQTRQEFSQNAIESLNTGASTIKLTDLGDESANLLALQVRQQISNTDEPLASEAQQYILKQFLIFGRSPKDNEGEPSWP